MPAAISRLGLSVLVAVWVLGVKQHSNTPKIVRALVLFSRPQTYTFLRQAKRTRRGGEKHTLAFPVDGGGECG